MIRIEDFKDNGYTEVELDNRTMRILYPYVDRMFQKRVKDDIGIKYFIDALYFSDAVEFEIHSYVNQVAIVTKFYAIGDITLAEIEELVDEYFVNAKLEYYEKEVE